MAQVRLDGDVEAAVRRLTVDGGSLAATANELLRAAITARDSAAAAPVAPAVPSASVTPMRRRLDRHQRRQLG